MGASGWRYFVPYQPDIQQALQELREDVFKRGAFKKNYFTGSDYRESLEELEEMFEILDANQIREVDRESLRITRKFAFLGDDAIPTPGTIDEAMVATLQSGTHSIIDVVEIADLPWQEDGYGIYPIP
jgi:hypothetical protein